MDTPPQLTRFDYEADRLGISRTFSKFNMLLRKSLCHGKVIVLE
jgi:hypothetical protein